MPLELSALAERLRAGPVALDGEIVALDESGAPSFARLQHRMHVREPTAALLRRVPIHLCAFDAHRRTGPTTAAPT